MNNLPLKPMQPPPERDPVYGFLLAVIGASSVVTLAVTLILVLGRDWRLDSADLVAGLLLFVLAFPIASIVVAAASLVFGLPFTWLAARLKIECALTYVLGGILGGSIMLAGGINSFFEIFQVAGMGYGGLCGLIWWHAYRRHL